jgi:catechol 2,3-dioxygenase-like lactoylglutathione lyase family enzyme
MSLSLNHIALWSSSEKNANTFFTDLLGFTFLYKFHATRTIIEDIFSINRPMNILVFGNDSLKIEIFINDQLQYDHHPINHICLNVDNIDDIFNRAKQYKLPRKVIKRDNRNIFFIKDFDGNLFELKNSKK